MTASGALSSRKENARERRREKPITSIVPHRKLSKHVFPRPRNRHYIHLCMRMPDKTTASEIGLMLSFKAERALRVATRPNLRQYLAPCVSRIGSMPLRYPMQHSYMRLYVVVSSVSTIVPSSFPGSPRRTCHIVTKTVLSSSSSVYAATSERHATAI